MTKLFISILIVPVLSLTLSFHLVEIEQKKPQEGWHCGLTLCLCDHVHEHHEEETLFSNSENVFDQWYSSTPISKLHLIEKDKEHAGTTLSGKPLLKFVTPITSVNSLSKQENLLTTRAFFSPYTLDNSPLKPPQNPISF